MKWISVKDDLPGNYSAVLMVVKGSQSTPISGFRAGKEWWEHGGDRHNAKLTSPVTHWMPLPDPPEAV